jgi:hypothetical protein
LHLLDDGRILRRNDEPVRHGALCARTEVS